MEHNEISAELSELIKKYRKTIYKKDDTVNLKVAREIAIAAGHKNPKIFIDPANEYLTVNYEEVDYFGDPVGEIIDLYNFCQYQIKRDTIVSPPSEVQANFSIMVKFNNKDFILEEDIILVSSSSFNPKFYVIEYLTDTQIGLRRIGFKYSAKTDSKKEKRVLPDAQSDNGILLSEKSVNHHKYEMNKDGYIRITGNQTFDYVKPYDPLEKYFNE